VEVVLLLLADDVVEDGGDADDRGGGEREVRFVFSVPWTTYTNSLYNYFFKYKFQGQFIFGVFWVF
jgi:hypothetical protein